MANGSTVRVGDVFDRWTVVEVLSRTFTVCVCSCGTRRKVRSQSLRLGESRSCGCRARFQAWLPPIPQHIKQTWYGMKQRCYCATARDFPAYGGRGITVCERWRHDVAAFYADMGDRPPGTSLDRIDNDGPYSPENCRWTTQHTQSRNMQQTVLLTFQGRTMCIADWAKIVGVTPATLGKRLRAKGWTLEMALTTPSLGGKRR